MPRVLTADELAEMKSGHGWQEYRPDPEDGQEIPFDEYMTEIVWLQGVQLMRDCCGKYSTGSSQPNEWYGVDWRIWDEKPSEELAKATAWGSHQRAGLNRRISGDHAKGETRSMTIEEWRDDKLGEYKIPLWKFLRIIHYYTERVGIYVVSGGNWQPGERNFWLSKDVFKGISAGQYQAELERLLRYYADVPVWNVCAEWTNDGLRADGNGQSAVTWLTARCHYYDIREGLALEKADRRRQQKRQYERKRREKKNGTAGSD